MSSSHGLSTQAIHAGEMRPRVEGAVCLPIFQSSTFAYAGQDDYDALVYMRLNNTPNHKVLHAKLAALEGTEAALVTSSGMSAITSALLALLTSGEHMIAQNVLYGGTHSFVTQDLADYGIGHTRVDPLEPSSWKAALLNSSKIFYVETLSNPLLQIPELELIVAFCKEHGLLSVIDNTFASPINFRPAELGFDVVLHSATKYLNGHSDIVAGVIAGSDAVVKRVLHRLNHLGGSLDTHACFLLHRGLKTLKLRVQQQNRNAQALAEWLEAQGARVNYAGLPTHASYERGRRWLQGCGGVLSFELPGDVEQTRRMLDALELPLQAPSLGGVESLVTRPCTTSHAGMTPAERKEAGISDKLVRFSVGIEDEADLLADFAQAFQKAGIASQA